METGDLQYVQRMNRELVIRTLLQHAPVSRVEIARATTLSPSTVTNAVSALMAEGLVQEIGAGSSTAVGRRPVLLDVCWDSRVVIGLSVLDNQLIGVRTNLRAEVKSRFSCPIAADTDMFAVTQSAVDTLLEYQDRSTVIGIGISTPGILDRKAGVIERSTNFQWDHLELGSFLAKYTGLPTILENDTNAAALGERYFGIGRGFHSFAYVHVGTGVGAGIVIEGRILLGNRGNSGEIGHLTIDRKGPKCRCGSHGCLEGYITWGALQPIVRSGLPSDTVHDMPTSTMGRAQLLANLYQRPEIRPALDERAHTMGVAIASLVTVIDPELIIVDGIYRQCEGFMDVVSAEVVSRLNNVTHYPPQIVLGKLGDHAPVLGAVALILEKNGFLNHTDSLSIREEDLNHAVPTNM